MSPHEPGTVAYWFGYRRWLFWRYYPGRLRWKLKNDLPFWIALRLPRSVALMAFVRVYGCIGRCDDNYGEICREWDRRTAELKAGRPQSPPRPQAPAGGFESMQCASTDATEVTRG